MAVSRSQLKKIEPYILYSRDPGDRFDVETATLSDGSIPARDFILNLKDKPRRKIIVRIERFAQHGRFTNTNHQKELTGGIYEFRDVKNGTRVFWYYPAGRRRRIVLTHGIVKGEKKLQTRHIKRAKAIRAEYERIVDDGIQ